MRTIGFDSQKYIRLQSQHIRERIEQFGGKLYLEFGGKLFDDYHASRVLPGFKPDSKLQMLLQLKEDAEIIIAINAADDKTREIDELLGQVRGQMETSEALAVKQSQIMGEVSVVAGHLDVSSSSMRDMASSISMPATSLEMPCRLPLQPPSISTFTILPSSTSISISREHTPLGL